MNNTNTGGAFNKLAASGTHLKNPYESKPIKVVVGKGTDLTDFDRIEKIAQRKLITQATSTALMEVAKRNEDWKWEQRFWCSYNCQSEIITTGTRSHANYCRQRCCTICLANRKAEKINRYLPSVESWPDPFFLTITAQSVKKDMLNSRVKETAKALRMIIARYKKRYQRGTEKQKFYGIWSLESNFNAKDKTYNPHIHLILPNLYVADTIMREWRLYWERRKVPIIKNAQRNRRVRKDRVKDLIETIKYGSKIFTEPDVMKKSKMKNTAFIYAGALYNILRAMDKINVFNTFGFTPIETIQPLKQSKTLDEYTEWEYNMELADWFTSEYKGRLTDYKPKPELEQLLASRVNTDME